jgi:hypothetical protein
MRVYLKRAYRSEMAEPDGTGGRTYWTDEQTCGDGNEIPDDLSDSSDSSGAGKTAQTYSESATADRDMSPERSPRILLPKEEYLRLRREGRCFRGKERGLLSRDCPRYEAQAPVEARTVYDKSGEDFR